MPHQHWLGKLANLNASKSADRGIAPNKPLMIFTVMDMIESGDVTDGWVKYDVRLVSRFRYSLGYTIIGYVAGRNISNFI